MSINEEERFGTGIPTFMGGDYINIKNVNSYDVAFIGIPIEYGASFRKGTTHAPSTIRRYSAWDRVDGSKYYDINEGVDYRANNLKIADLGDLLLSETAPLDDFKKISSYLARIPDKTFPLVVGGDHSITYPCFRGIMSGSKKQKMAILHFDAHLDVEKNYLNMPEIWHGNVFRKLISEGSIDGNDIFSIGPRGIIPKKWADYASKQNINILTSRQIKNGILSEITKSLLEKLAKYDGVYITFDIDVLDVGSAPGTGIPQSGGLSPQEIIFIMRALRKINVIGMDVVELSPNYDPTGQTAMIVCEMLFNFLAFGLRKT